MNLEERLRRIEAALIPAEAAVGATFGPADDRPPPPSDPKAMLAYKEACAMDDSVCGIAPIENLE